MSKNWKSDLTAPPVGTEKGLAGRLWEALTNHLYNIPNSKTVWLDIDFPLIVKTTGVGKPSLQTFNTNFEALRWAVGDSQSTEFQEFIHAWKEGSPVTWHLHFVTNGTNVNDRFVKWQIDFCFANFSSAYNATQTVSAEITIPANTPSNTHIIASIGTFTPTGIRIGAHCKAKLTRIASAGSAPTNDPFCDLMQMHIECDSVGSATIQNK